MNLNEFTTQELEVLADMLQVKISMRYDRMRNVRFDGMRNKIQKELHAYELMKVKVNNALGKFGE